VRGVTAPQRTVFQPPIRELSNRSGVGGAPLSTVLGWVDFGAPGVDTQGDLPPSWKTETVMGLIGRFAALAMLVVLSLSTAIGCSGNRDYDEEVRDAFLTNCEYAGSSPSVCISALECIEERLTQSDFEYEENKLLLTGELFERMVEVTARCLNR